MWPTGPIGFVFSRGDAEDRSSMMSCLRVANKWSHEYGVRIASGMLEILCESNGQEVKIRGVWHYWIE